MGSYRGGLSATLVISGTRSFPGAYLARRAARAARAVWMRAALAARKASRRCEGVGREDSVVRRERKR